MYKKVKRYLPVLLALALVLAVAAPTFAQSVSTTTLQIDSSTITSGLFQGANIILLALGAVVFLMAGFTFGVSILKGLLRIIGNVSI